ncbi:MAG: hypothetical protein AAFU65_12990, partial [Pseudomonadota bacterium]
MSRISDHFRQMPLRSFLTGTIVALGLIPLAISGVLNWHAGSNALLDQAFDQLESVRELKKSEVERFVRATTKETQALAGGPFIVDGVLGLMDAYRQLPAQALPEGATIAALQRTNTKTTADRFSAAYRERTGQSLAPPALATSAAGTVARYLYVTQNPNDYTELSRLDHAGDASGYTRLHRRYHPHF